MNPIAWLVEAPGVAATVVLDKVSADIFAAIDLRVTPLIAAPPEQPAEQRAIREWWASMPADQQRAILMRRDPASCPCGEGALAGHPYTWCQPHPAWLPAATQPPPVGEADAELAERLDDAWAGRGEYADGDVEILRALCGEALMAVRHLAALTCDAPPEGAPTWQGLADVLSELDAEARKATASGPAGRKWSAGVERAVMAVRALLAGIPKEEGDAG